MATATIPELIQPGTLYTPDDSAVSVESAWCPNGDDGLHIDGTIANFRAYQPAIADVHYPSTTSVPMTVMFWIDTPDSYFSSNWASSLHAGGVILGVMDITAVPGTGANDMGQSFSTSAFSWAIGHGKSSGQMYKSLVYHRAMGAASRARLSSNGLSTSNMYTYRDPGGGNPGTVRVNGLTTPGGHSSSGGTPGTPDTLTAPYFSIGPYSTVAGWAFPDKNVYLAKIAIWMGSLISDTEVSDLYTSMTLGPPSP